MSRVEQWGIFELSLSGPDAGNPFCDVQLAARFTHADSRGDVTSALRSDGFYDSDGTYRVRFMPDRIGTWIYETESNVATLNGQRGEFECIAPTEGNYGPVRVRDTWHFAYADGTPFRPIGTTCYSWIHASEEMQEETLVSLRESAFNKVRMLVLPARHSKITCFPFEGDPEKGWDFSRFDPAYFCHVEKRVADLMRLGIEADLILFHPYDEGAYGFDRMESEIDDRYVRYVVARLAAYRNVWWSMANEYDFLKEKTIDDWDRIFRIVQERDPYSRLRSIHNGGILYDVSKPWVTHASIQAGILVEEFGRAWILREAYRKPVIYDEICYEGCINRRWGHLTGEEMVHRFWQATVAGSYATHGESLHVQGLRSWVGVGGRLSGESWKRIAFLKRILDEGPSEGLEPIDRWWTTGVAGKRGEYYLIYLGKSEAREWRFKIPSSKTPLPDKATFAVDIIDTWNMTITTVPATFRPTTEGEYYFGCNGASVSLPGRPYMALRIRRIQL